MGRSKKRKVEGTRPRGEMEKGTNSDLNRESESDKYSRGSSSKKQSGAGAAQWLTHNTQHTLNKE